MTLEQSIALAKAAQERERAAFERETGARICRETGQILRDGDDHEHKFQPAALHRAR